MALKYKVKAKEEVPAELQRFYLEKHGEIVLDVEGAVEKGKRMSCGRRMRRCRGNGMS